MVTDAQPSRFRPRLVPTLATVAVLPLLLWLGAWQLDRAEQKRALSDAFSAARAAPTAPYAVTLPRFARVSVRGRYDATHQFLLDAMVHDGASGFRVLTPLRLDDGRVLLVDRGWVAGDPARRALPDVAIAAAAAPREVLGLIDELPRAGVALAPADTGAAAAWPRVLLYPTPVALAAAYGAPLEPRLVRLDPTAADGYQRGFRPDLGLSRERHLGYAFTWFALAATLVAIWVVTNLRRPEPRP